MVIITDLKIHKDLHKDMWWVHDRVEDQDKYTRGDV